MSTFELGQTLTFVVQVTDDDGAAADLGGGDPTCTVTRPDGTTGTAAVTRKGPGLYWGSIASTQVGRWVGTFTGTGNNSGKLPWSDVADVWPADPRLIVSLADAKAELNMTTTVNDDELRLYIAATTEIVEDLIGPVLSQTRTEWLDGGWTHVMVDCPPVAAVSSVVEVYGAGVQRTLSEQPLDGASFDSYGYTVDREIGKIIRRISGREAPFAPGRANVKITYTTGFGGIIPPNVILGARIIAAHLYQTGQQSRKGKAAPDEATVLGYAVPARALEVLNAQIANRGIA